MSEIGPSTLTLREAADATGVSLPALRRRAERGSLRTVKRDRGDGVVRLVPRSELVRVGLLEDDQEDLRAELDRLHAQVADQRRLMEYAESAHQVELQAHEQTRAALLEERARATAATTRSEDLQADLDAIAAAGPIKALRLRRRLKTTG